MVVIKFFVLLSGFVAVGFGVQNATGAFLLQHQQPLHGVVARASDTVLFSKGWKQGGPGKVVSETEYVNVDSDGNDAWKTMDIVDIINDGGVGVLPTDTGYGFVTRVDSKAGLERILRIKGMHTCKKPLSVLCSDLSSIEKYSYGINKSVFKLLKKYLPGPYTFILPATNELPKAFFFDVKGGKHTWSRKTVGVRIPADPVLRYLQDDLLGGVSLFVSSLPIEEETEDGQLLYCKLDRDAQWCNEVDFIVDAGERPYDGSTIYDASQVGMPELVREGMGDLELVL